MLRMSAADSHRSSETTPIGDGHADPAGRAPSPAVSRDVSRAAQSTVRELTHGARIVTANAGDHSLILQLLVQARQALIAEDFQSRLDEPNYRPSNRLLVRRGNQLLGHVHVASHIAWFEGLRVPMVKFEDFATLPEFEDSPYAEELLKSAESIAAAEGAIVAVMHAQRSDWVESQGWTRWRGQGHTRANARAVLAHLDAQEQVRRRKRSDVHVRLWRHFELESIRQIYDETAAALWGPLYRSEECWQWLVGRKAQDHVLLAVQRDKPTLESPDAIEQDAEQAVGYAIVRGSAIVELMTLPRRPASRVQLLASACREAIDRDHNSISLYTPASDPLHELLVMAGGHWIGDRTSPGPRWMMRLLAPERWVERCYPLWRERSQACDVPRPFEMGFDTGGAALLFTLTRRSARLEPVDSLPARRAECSRQALQSLLTGNLDIAAAIQQRQLRLSHPELAAPLTAIFAPRLFWQSPLELMRL